MITQELYCKDDNSKETPDNLRSVRVMVQMS